VAGAATIRPVEPQDFDAIDELVAAAYGEFARVLSPDNWERMRLGLRGAAQALPGSVKLLAERDGRLAGFVIYRPIGVPDASAVPQEWPAIRLLSVAPWARGEGIGRMLTDACIDLALRHGAKVIGLHTSEIMNVARPMYERMGFQIVRELEPRFGVRYWLYKKELA
jgi:ribosomal protein S18 acetylase RimI-like enzyme